MMHMTKIASLSPGGGVEKLISATLRFPPGLYWLPLRSHFKPTWRILQQPACTQFNCEVGVTKNRHLYYEKTRHYKLVGATLPSGVSPALGGGIVCCLIGLGRLIGGRHARPVR